MSVTLILSDHQRTTLLLALGLARASAETYELYAPKAAKPHWALYRDEATELLDLVTEAPRDVETIHTVLGLPSQCRAVLEIGPRDDDPTLLKWHRCHYQSEHPDDPHECLCGAEW